jgi:alkylated DNA repair protein (DNA oxidative demethylase)
VGDRRARPVTASAALRGRTVSFKLRSGVVILSGEGRLAFHGVDRIYPATSALLKNGGRINLTLSG